MAGNDEAARSGLAREVLADRLADRTARIGVLGLGVAGLYQAVEFAYCGYPVLGYDRDPRVVKDVRAARVPVGDIPTALLKHHLDTGRLAVTGQPADLQLCQVLVIAVPTAVTDAGEPDVSCVAAAVETIRAVARSPLLVVLKSTAYPGMTAAAVASELAGTFGPPGEKLFVAYAPERGDPGNRRLAESVVSPRVVAGATPACADLVGLLYRTMGAQVEVASSLTAAEATKLHENVYRLVNISYANELAEYCRDIGVDPHEVVTLASTKPFGFTPFRPGLGVGGMYLPVNARYLMAGAVSIGAAMPTLRAAIETNQALPGVLAERVGRWLGVDLRGARILTLGVTYKPDHPDWRNSPALKLCHALQARGALVRAVDPLLDGMDGVAGVPLVPLDRDNLAWAQAVLRLVPHSCFADVTQERVRGRPVIAL